MRKLWRPASRRVASAADLRHSIGRNETTVVGFFAGANDFYEEFVIAVQELRGLRPETLTNQSGAVLLATTNHQ